MRAPLVKKAAIPLLLLLLGLIATRPVAQSPGTAAQSHTTTTRTNNPDGGVTVTTTTTYKDGETTTSTTYDKDGHDAGTTRTDIQTKDGETTTTTTKYDGAGHETGRTVERVDKDGNKTITTYDGQGHETGKKTVPSTAKGTQSSLEGTVLPDDLHAGQPFSFSVPQIPSQSEVNIQTVDGVVVDHKATDKYGRIFLAAGLPAGAYLISLGHNTNVGRIEIRPTPSDVLQRTWEHPPEQPRLVNPPDSMKAGDPLWLSGHGFSPNSTEMKASLYAGGHTHEVMVLAATEDQLKLAPINDIKPGQAELKITNNATQQGAPSQPLYFYDLQGHLQQNKLKRGQETVIVLDSQPVDFRMKVYLTISGHATFAGGQAATAVVIDHGHASIPIIADRGAGDFHIEYEGTPLEQPKHAGCACGCGGTAQPACAHKGCSCSNSSIARTPQIASCSCGCGGTAQPACAHKGCACSKAMQAAAIAGCSCGCGGTAQPACAHKNCACANAVSVASEFRKKTASCSCGCGGTAQPACAHKGCVCSKAEDLGLPFTLQPRLENVSQKPEKTTGKAGCSCGCGGTAQPRCAHKACGCGGSLTDAQ